MAFQKVGRSLHTSLILAILVVQPTTSSMPAKHRLLYVDDDQDNLLAFRSVFRRNYDVTTATSGAEALEILEQKSFPLVISDQRMPNMSGAELFAIMEAKYPESLRMIMTGYSDLQAIIDAINEGKIYYYISKPWVADELKIVIDHAFERQALKMENRELTQENILAQFEALKNQVNPHFLFNSLSALRSLISTNQDKAIEFTDRFSHLYRAMLNLRDQSLITLREELDFVDTYIFLQKTRYDHAIQYQLTITEQQKEDVIPPFAIQLAVENCIKHNVISTNMPLYIKVRHRGDFMEITNNLQKRQTPADSTGTGVKNLSSRYRLLQLPAPKFYQEQANYIVELPIVANI